MKQRADSRGFTLIEVLVTMIVMAAGLLGLAKMQALAISATKTSGSRGLISLQASGLADLMHADRAYWASGVAPARFTAFGTTVIDPTHVLDAALVGAACTLFCTPAQLAANDVQAWMLDMNNQFPSYTAKVDCTNGVGQPVSCQIYITWQEKTVAINKTTATGSSKQNSTESFSVYVQP